MLELRMGRRTWVAAACVGIAAALAAGAAAWWLTTQQALAREQAAAARLQQQLRQQPVAAASTPVDPRQAWLQRLTHDTPAVEGLIGDMQRLGAGLGVTLVSLSTQRTPATPQALGHVDVTLTLRGSYANLRSALGELLSQHAGVVLQRFSLRRLSAPAELEAQVALQWALPPRADAGAKP